MPFEKFEGPFSDVDLLGCRNLFCGERLILDLFEYLQSGPEGDAQMQGLTVPGTHPIGLTESSRIWRLTFERPFAVRVHNRILHRREKSDETVHPRRCLFSEDSDWMREFDFDSLRLPEFRPTQYLFSTLDDVIEILADCLPIIEELPHEIPGRGHVSEGHL